MIKETKQELYVSPEVEVYEIKARRVVCASENGSYPGFTNDDDYYGF